MIFVRPQICKTRPNLAQIIGQVKVLVVRNVAIQSRAMEEGVPYQTFFASVIHKYVSGRLIEKPSRLTTRRLTGKTAKILEKFAATHSFDGPQRSLQLYEKWRGSILGPGDAVVQVVVAAVSERVDNPTGCWF
ncbi:MAG: hypothetical protein ACSLFH_09945 [Desulfuromonadales bacterium]